MPATPLFTSLEQLLKNLGYDSHASEENTVYSRQITFKIKVLYAQTDFRRRTCSTLHRTRRYGLKTLRS